MTPVGGLNDTNVTATAAAAVRTTLGAMATAASPTVVPTTTQQGQQHVAHVVFDAETEVDAGMGPRTSLGIPVKLLWVPYMCFSLMLLTLMCVSFVRFHFKNGHKYRRSSRFWELIITFQRFIQNLSSQTGDTGGGGGRGGRGGGGGSRGNHSNAAGGSTSPPNGGVNISMHGGGDASSPSQHLLSEPNHPSQPSTSSSSSKATNQHLLHQQHQPQKQQQQPPVTSQTKSKRTRRPLVFTSNLNGSMVDVRLGQVDSLSTFRNMPFPKHYPDPRDYPNIWHSAGDESSSSSRPQYRAPPQYHHEYQPPKRHTFFTHAPRAPEQEDDEVFLLQQTKL